MNTHAVNVDYSKVTLCPLTIQSKCLIMHGLFSEYSSQFNYSCLSSDPLNSDVLIIMASVQTANDQK